MSALSYTPGGVTAVTVYGAATGAIGASSASGGTAPYSASWSSSPGATTISSQDFTAKSNLLAGSYKIAVSDAVNNQVSYTYTVPQNQPITIVPGNVTNVAVYGGNTGSIAASQISGGTGAYSYLWTTSDGSGLQPTALGQSQLTAGHYTLKVTDSAGATATAYFAVTQNSAISIVLGQVTPVNIYGQSTGSIGQSSVTGGTAVYTISWSSNTPQPTSIAAKNGIVAGSYVLTVTDSASATATATAIVTQSGQLIIAAPVVQPVNIYGTRTGVVGKPVITGGVQPYLYLWSYAALYQGQPPFSVPNPTVIETKTSLPGGYYTLSVKDKYGATSSGTFLVPELPQIAVSGAVISRVSIFGGSDGAITISSSNVSGGNGYYSFTWSDIGTVPSLVSRTLLSANTYTLTIQDGYGAVKIVTFVVPQNPFFSIVPGHISKFSKRSSKGGSIAESSFSGGTGQLKSCSWTSSASSTTPIVSSTLGAQNGLSKGVYTLVILDTAGAVSTYNFNVAAA
jgi:hypothetical protein